MQGPLHPAAKATLLAALDLGWADPHRRYAHARTARRLLDQAREVIAGGLRVRPDEVSFTPGGSEALRAGLGGLRYAARRTGARVVTSAVEHSAILTEVAGAAAQADDPQVHAAVPVDRWGRLDVDAWQVAVAVPGTVLSCLQSANGEVGTRQPLGPALEACRARGIPLLVDATASLGRDPVPTEFDVLAGDARSWGGPPGVGVLVVREGVRWHRPGPPTEVERGRTPIEPVVALALAAAEAWQQTDAVREQDATAARDLVARMRAAATSVPEVEVVGDPLDRLPHVLTFSCLLADGEMLVDEFDRRGLAVASGSACTSRTLEPSHVLAAMGVLTHGNVRVTLPLGAVAPEREAVVDRFCAELGPVVAAVRAQGLDP